MTTGIQRRFNNRSAKTCEWTYGVTNNFGTTEQLSEALYIVVNLNHFVGRSLNTGNLFDSLFNRLRVTTRGNEWQLIFAQKLSDRRAV